ncbi:hypothetical protein K502DRAFT_346376 [Neoconidiobolus thromboides FSU 785]|nr:hypothetical protein K502DRAFT_346376 [Neoconidiobolus thromboides FSU 785]
MGYVSGFSVVVIALIALLAILNGILLFLAIKVKPRTKDINFIIIICCLQFLIPIIGFSNMISYIGTDTYLLSKRLGCQISGFFTALVFFYQVITNLCLAVERLSHITKKDYLNYFYFPTFLASISFLLLLLVSASENLLIISASGIICMPSPTHGILPGMAFFLFLFCMVSSSIVIFYCYLKLAIYTNNLSSFIEIGPDSAYKIKNDIKRGWSVKWVSIRIFSILAVYGTCTFSSILCLVIEAYFEIKFGFGSVAQSNLNMAAILLFIIGTIASLLLLLIIHSGISKQAKKIFKDKQSG